LPLAFVRSPSTGRIFDPNRAQGASPAGARQLEGGSGGKPTWQGGLPGGRVILAALSLGPEIPHRHAQGLGQLPGGARLSPRARKQPLVTARGLARPSGERRPVIRRVGFPRPRSSMKRGVPARLRREGLCATTALRGQGVGQVRALPGPTDRSSSDLAGPTCGSNPSGENPRVTDVGQDKALALIRNVSPRFPLHYT